MFDFIDKGKVLSIFNTDTIIKIGDATQEPPIPCHLFVKDTQLFSMQTSETPIFVYGELYTDIEVPTISQNVRIAKMNPKTGEPIAYYEGTPSRPIVWQSRKKYAVRFFDAVEPEYPKIEEVEFWDSENNVWINGAVGLTVEFIDDKTANPDSGFSLTQTVYGDKTYQINGTDIVLNAYPYFYPVIFRNKDNTKFYSFDSNTPESVWIYTLTDNPDDGLPIEFGVDYWQDNQWLDTGGTIKLNKKDKQFNFVSGFSTVTDEFGEKSIKAQKNNIYISGYSTFYLREQGGTQRIFKCENNAADVRYAVNYQIVNAPG